jgi:glycosyltransferase involved in cell wall biosynthesis
MEWMSTVLAIVIGLGCLSWVVFYGFVVRSVVQIDRFETVPVESCDPWPRLSVVIPACNEGDTLREALESLRGQDYPELEIIVVDDRSDDETPRLVDELAADDPRVSALHVETLPEGWLGKVNAMQVGVEHSTGDLLLFTDADVHFATDALRRAVSALQRRGLDHLTIMPSVVSDRLMLEAAYSAFGTLLIATTRPHRMRDPSSDAVVGVGAFNLLRRSAYDKTPGLQWIRMDVADDTALALMLRRHGARQEVFFGTTDVNLDWYPTVAALIRGLEKNLFGIGTGYNVFRALLAGVGIAFFASAPYLALLLPGGAPGIAACSVALATMLGANVVVSWKMKRGWLQILLAPLAWLVILVALVRSTFVTVRNGGITWRGTHYPLEELRRMQRFDLD